MKIKDIRIDQLVYTKNVGFPFNRTDDGHESFEGASGLVIGVNVGANKQMVDIEFLFPMKTPHGTMKKCLFHPEQLRAENRPWLKKNLVRILTFKTKVADVAKFLNQMVDEDNS